MQKVDNKRLKEIIPLLLFASLIIAFESCKSGYGCEATQEIARHKEKALESNSSKRGKSKLFSKKQYKKRKKKS